MEKLKKIGFFHFGENDKNDPISSLLKALALFRTKSPELSDCLLVLPEAFNVRGGYFGEDHPDASIGSALKQISAKTKIAFVAGLIEPGVGCNAAYLIDGARCHLLSRKRQYTRGKGAYTLYRPCQLDDDPVAHRGLRIAALVCNEADYSGGNSRRERRRDKVLNAIEALPAGPIVLCVPACLSHPIAEKVVRLWEEPDAMVIANSHLQCASVIRIKPNTPEPLQRNDSGHWGFNVIELCTLGKIV